LNGTSGHPPTSARPRIPLRRGKKGDVNYKEEVK
jgi:hypothetical protein